MPITSQFSTIWNSRIRIGASFGIETSTSLSAHSWVPESCGESCPPALNGHQSAYRITLSIEPLEVEEWLTTLKKEEELENPTLDRLRRVMSLVYRHGQRYG